MKKFLMYGLLLAGVVLTSCQYTELVSEVDGGGTPRNEQARLQITVEEQAGSMMPSTRGPVASTEYEPGVYNLHLLFFEHTTDGSGKLVADYDVASTYLTQTTSIYVDGEPFELEIGTGEGVNLSHTERYTVLAYANIDNVAGLTTLVEGTTTENQVREILNEYPDNEWVRVIQTTGNNSLPMSGITTKEPDQELVTLKLTRMVARIDVQIQMEGYELVGRGTHVYYMAQKSRIWESLDPDDNGISQVYNYTSGEGYNTEGNLGKSALGNYVFENFVGDPLANKDKLTTLVLQMKHTSGTPKFYRVDLYPEGEGQNLKRNHVYQITVKGIVSEGAATAEAALNSDEKMLDYTINNWAVDEEGLIITDGENTLVAPSRYIRFGPEGESRQFQLYTDGTGTLEITRRNLPNGFTVTLNGNMMTVTVDPLPDPDPDGHQEERTGEVELGFAGLRGSIQIVQSPRDDNFLFVDKHSSELTSWPAGGENTSVPNANEITVSASKNWTAQIYNTSNNANPGFTFNPSGRSLPEDLKISGQPGGKIKVYATGPNPSNRIRQGFVIISLDDKKYRQVVVLQQQATGKVEISPVYNPAKGLPFDASGYAKLVDNGATQNYYRIYVLPGTVGNSATLNIWEASLSGTHADFFNLTKVDDPVAPYVVISAKGENNPDNPGFNFGGAKEAMLTIKLPGGNTATGSAIELPVTQEPFVFNIRRVSRLARVPVKGVYEHVNTKFPGIPGVSDLINGYVEYEVNIPNGLTWKAEIVDQSHPNSGVTEWRRHEGFILDDDDQRVTGLTLRSSSQTLRVGFDKIYYPMIHWDQMPGGLGTPTTSPDYNIPKVGIKVSVTGLETLYNETISTEQEPLTAKTPDILEGVWGENNPGDTYGGIGTYQWGSYMQRYSDMILSSGTSETNNFGPEGIVRTPVVVRESNLTYGLVHPWPATTNVSNTRNYLHMGGHDSGANNSSNSHSWSLGAYQAVERWRTSSETEGFAFFIVDQDQWTESNFRASSSMGVLGWNGHYGDGSDSTVPGSSSDKRVMKYLMNGPFGAISGANFDFYVDGISTKIVKNSLASTANAVSLLEDAAGVLLAIDPENRIAYLGDCQSFGSEGEWAENATDDGVDKKRFVRNFASIMILSAMYGSHFYDLLREDCELPLYFIRSNDSSRVLVDD